VEPVPTVAFFVGEDSEPSAQYLRTVSLMLSTMSSTAETIDTDTGFLYMTFFPHGVPRVSLKTYGGNFYSVTALPNVLPTMTKYCKATIIIIIVC